MSTEEKTGQQKGLAGAGDSSGESADGGPPMGSADIGDAIHRKTAQLDQQILALLNERARACQELADFSKAGQSGNPGETAEIYWPEREARTLKELARSNEGPLGDAAVQHIFREILSASLALEQRMRVAYLGPEGTYSHAAAERHFGQSVQTVPEAGIADIFQAVEAGKASFGVVPVENSTEGTINLTLDLLVQTPLRVCGELNLRIQHCLLSQVQTLSEIASVHAHPQSLAQCRHWLKENLPQAVQVSESSNAAAARLAVEQPGSAAIAGETAARLYRLHCLVRGIEDEKNNTTRFLVIGDQDVPPSGDDSTLIMFVAPHRPGGLRKLLQPLEEAGVSMTRIESRPSRSALWDYIFFIDVNGHQDDATLGPVIGQLRELAPLLKVLGSYPRAL